MLRRHQRKPPKAGYQPVLQLLVEAARKDLATAGAAHVNRAEWIAAAELYLKLQSICRPLGPDETAEHEVEQALAMAGITWSWEELDLVLSLPGWVPAKPREVAIQPGLFDEP